MPGSSGGGIPTVSPGRPAPQQSMSGLEVEELAEAGKVRSLPAPSREKEVVGAHLFLQVIYLCGSKNLTL